MDGLVATLLAQALTYRLLVPLAEEEKCILARADAASLAELNGSRQAILTKLEMDRPAALGRLAAAFGVDLKTLTGAPSARSGSRRGSRAQPVRMELTGVLTGLLERHRKNRVLAERTLACLRGLFTKVTAALTGGRRSDQALDQLCCWTAEGRVRAMSWILGDLHDTWARP
jgi:hypothetical protein